jgi:hypothetical protein
MNEAVDEALMDFELNLTTTRGKELMRGRPCSRTLPP